MGPHVAFALRNEQDTHKVQYSKVGKGDVSAAVLGTIVATFVGYLALATVGSGAIDLTDLTVSLWYAGLALILGREVGAVLRPSPDNIEDNLELEFGPDFEGDIWDEFGG